jgi:hypothetical protein
MRWILAVLVLIAAGTGDLATAHSRSESFSSWEIDGRTVRVTFTVQSREVTRIPWQEELAPDLAVQLTRYLDSRLGVAAGSELCPALEPMRPLVSSRGFVRVEAAWRCESGEQLTLRNDAFFDLAASHVNFGRVRTTAGGRSEYLFNDTLRTWPIGSSLVDDGATAADKGTALTDFVMLGVGHILSGWDHLAFLLGLLLICRRFADIVFVVTGFTLGHSIALALAVLDVVRPEIAPIEALIGLTIALVAVENVSQSGRDTRLMAAVVGASLLLMTLPGIAGIGNVAPAVTGGFALFSYCYLRLTDELRGKVRLRVIMTALFGLIHGFGFANALIEAELPTGRLAAALFGFNVGVELGQLLAVAGLVTLAALGRRLWAEMPQRVTADIISAALCALGVFWFVGRAYA